MVYSHKEWMSLSELEKFVGEHPKVWGKSKMLFHPENGQITPHGCGQCPFCEGEMSFNCQCLTFEVRW